MGLDGRGLSELFLRVSLPPASGLTTANVLESSAKTKNSKAFWNAILSTPQAFLLGASTYSRLLSVRGEWAHIAYKWANAISVAGTLTVIALPMIVRGAEHLAETNDHPFLAKALSHFNTALALVNKIIVAAASALGLMMALDIGSPFFLAAYGSFAVLNIGSALYSIVSLVQKNLSISMQISFKES